jgi:hypothetical protein
LITDRSELFKYEKIRKLNSQLFLKVISFKRLKRSLGDSSLMIPMSFEQLRTFPLI